MKKYVWLLIEEMSFYHYSAKSVLDIYDSEKKALGALGTAQMDQIHAIEDGDDEIFENGKYEMTVSEDNSVEFFDKENGSSLSYFVVKHEVK